MLAPHSFDTSQENCRRQRAALQAAIAALEDGTDDADLARLLEIEETFEEVGVSSQRVNLSDVVCLSVGLSGLSPAFLFVDARGHVVSCLTGKCEVQEGPTIDREEKPRPASSLS